MKAEPKSTFSCARVEIYAMNSSRICNVCWTILLGRESVPTYANLNLA